MPSATRSIVCVLFVLVAGCEGAPAAMPDVPSPDVIADDLAGDVIAERPAEDVVDAHAPMDAADDGDVQGPCALDISSPDTSGRAVGYIRFANLVRGAGTVRFRARSLPMFAPAYVEAVVLEGTATEHIQTLPVSYEVHVESAGDASAGYTVDAAGSDGGILTDGPSAAPPPCAPDAGVGDFVAPLCTDVYFFAGCTVVLAGSERGEPMLQDQRRMWRVADPAGRGNDCYVGRVRSANWYAGGGQLDLDSPGVELGRAVDYLEITGGRTVPIGPLRVSARDSDGGAPRGDFTVGVVAAGHQHTLHVWGDARSTTNRGVNAILLDDVSPTFR